MCLIMLKPANIEMPPEDYIRTAFRTNPDGFGLAYWAAGMPKVKIIKGAMLISDAMNMVDRIPKPKAKFVMMHFRNATQGKICPENCHPYPLSSLPEELKAVELDADIVLSHNGIISGVEEPLAKGETFVAKMKQDFTDSQLFIKNYLATLGWKVTSPLVQSLIYKAAPSRYGLLTRKGAWTIGSFDTEDGIRYSNSSYKTYKYTGYSDENYGQWAGMEGGEYNQGRFRLNRDETLRGKDATHTTYPYRASAAGNYDRCDGCRAYLLKTWLNEVGNAMLCNSCMTIADKVGIAADKFKSGDLSYLFPPSDETKALVATSP